MTEAASSSAPAEGGARGGTRTWAERVLAVLWKGRQLTHAYASQMSDDDLVALGTAIGVVRRDADRMMAVVAAEQAERSRVRAQEVGLARRRGQGDGSGIVSSQTGGSSAEANRLIELGEALRQAEQAASRDANPEPEPAPGPGPGPAPDPDSQPSPEAGPGPQPEPEPEPEPERPVFAHVAAAVNAGRLGVEAAAMIMRMLRRIADRVDAQVLDEAERELVEAARWMRLERLAGLITRTEQRLDAAHREELARARRERRFLRIGESPDGMVWVRGQLDPDNGAPLVAVMQAMVNQNFRLRKQAQDAKSAGHAVVVDERTPEQVRADAMGDFARHLAGCDVDVLPHAGVTMVVRTSLEDLRQGLGGTVDGLAAGLDAGALRRAAAAAGIIPQVLGGASVVLDQGRAKRGFTHAQKLALVQRDGGCAMCGAPPSWCDAHHITPWAHGGRTDLSNGVMLCVRCHHDIHRDHWHIDATATHVWFTPPPTVDPQRRRRPGGRQLFDSLPPHKPSPDDITERCAMTAPTPCAVGPAEPAEFAEPRGPSETKLEHRSRNGDGRVVPHGRRDRPRCTSLVERRMASALERARAG